MRPHQDAPLSHLAAAHPSGPRPKQRAGFQPDTELALRYHTLVQVEAWRYSMLQGDPSLMVVPHITPP